MFATCLSLQSVPLFNTSAVTSMNSMFSNCYSIESVPLFNTSAVTSMNSMFSNCYSLQSVPLFNTAAVTNMGGMFYSCLSLQSVPLFNTVAVTNMSDMFNACRSLDDCPVIFRVNSSLQATQLNQASLQNVFNNLATVTTGTTLTITGAWGASGAVTSNSCTTTAGSAVITTVNTTGVTVGMQVTNTNTPLTTPIAVAFTDSTDTVNLTAHGLSNGDEVSFFTIVTTTGIVINTIYYVVNATTNDFQVSSSFGGTALALTNNGSGTMRYRASVVSIVAGTSITMNRKMTGSGTQNLIFRNLQTGTALMKNWTITG
jgi:surface protein